MPERATGPVVLKAIIMKYRYINTSAIQTLTNELASMKIINEPGQNVLSLSKKVYDIAAQIEGGSEHPPSDLSYLVTCTYLTATVELFRNPLIPIHQSVQKDPLSYSYRNIITKLKNNSRVPQPIVKVTKITN